MDDEPKPNRLRQVSYALLALGFLGVAGSVCGSAIAPETINMSTFCLPSMIPIILGGAGLVMSITPYFTSRDLREHIAPGQSPEGYD